MTAGGYRVPWAQAVRWGCAARTHSAVSRSAGQQEAGVREARPEIPVRPGLAQPAPGGSLWLAAVAQLAERMARQPQAGVLALPLFLACQAGLPARPPLRAGNSWAVRCAAPPARTRPGQPHCNHPE